MADKVFINGMAAVHAGSSAQGIAMPDVCLCPPSPPAGPIPTPLPNIFKAADLTCGAATVFIEGNPVGNMNSYIQKSTGNAVSRPTGGGVISHAVEGAAYPVMGSFDVFIESSPALKIFDLWTANHMPGAKMPPNTPPTPLMGAMSVPAMAPEVATKDMSKGKKDQKSWVRFVVQDKEGLPVAWVKYSAKLPDGRIAEGRTPPGGIVELRGLPKGQVELSFVDFDAASFESAKAGNECGELRVHVVRQGETAAQIAWKYGFADVGTVWHHPDNRELAKARPNPDVLKPGDKVAVPPHKAAVFKLAAEQETKITAKRPAQRLHLTIELDVGEPAANARYELTFRDGRKLHRRKGTTGGDGLLDEKLPLSATQLRLCLWPKDSKGKTDCLILDLGLGHLDPVEDLSGVQARLENLGFHCGDEEGELGPRTQAALKRFRAQHKIEEADLLGPATLKQLEKEQKA
jgi:N-acetylmuramoyl-L-alanine amidase